MEPYHLIVTAVIFHELAHAFTKFFFYDNDTPRGICNDEQGSGESGWRVEEKIMGGYLRVEWANKMQFGDMLSIDDMVLVKGKKKFKISKAIKLLWCCSSNPFKGNDVAKKMLSSLKRTKFIQPAEETMKKHISPPGSVQARVAEPTKKPRGVHTVPVESCTGLGISFGSFVGQDKRNIIYDGYNY
jgi:hypothetical protein